MFDVRCFADLEMGKGKIAAQCCHAALGAYRNVQECLLAVETARQMGDVPGIPNAKLEAQAQLVEWLERWEQSGEAKVVVKVPVSF